MKSFGIGNLVMALAFAILVGLGVWWWQDTMERRPEAVPYESDAARKDKHLAARRLLAAEGLRPLPASSLDEALKRKVKPGVMLIGRRDGVISAEQGQALLDWVAQGGVLITTLPAEHDEDGAADPIAQFCKVNTQIAIFEPQPGMAPKRPTTPTTIALHLPEDDAPPRTLMLEQGAFTLHRFDNNGPRPIWQDDTGRHVLAFALGKGLVVATDYDRFAGADLIRQDHGELLITLARMASPKSGFDFIESLDIPPWQQLFWNHAPQFILSAAALLLILLWRGLMRFGPVLADPPIDRRAVTEHIEASARWLWLRAPGRHALLAAVRAAVLDRYTRRFPALAKLGPAELANRIASMRNLPIEEVEAALNHLPANSPQGFTQQIKTLQLLRNHHER